jgi:hypothetical protein
MPSRNGRQRTKVKSGPDTSVLPSSVGEVHVSEIANVALEILGTSTLLLRLTATTLEASEIALRF